MERTKVIDLVIEVILAAQKLAGPQKNDEFFRLQSLEGQLVIDEFSELFPDATDLKRRLVKWDYKPAEIDMLVRAYLPKNEPDGKINF